MKVPLRQQATEYDCVPTSLVNALTYLFKRAELPPFVVHRIYKDCLDYESSRGTTGRAIRDIGHWLGCYREKRFAAFAVQANYLCHNQVHLKPNSKITTCLDAGGVVVMCVQIGKYDRHCLLALGQDEDWLYCHEPYCRSQRNIDSEAVQFIKSSTDHSANLRIRKNWLEKEYDHNAHPRERKYLFGRINNRECLLLNRISTEGP